MPEFRYRAIDSAGRSITGSISALTRDAAVKTIAAEGNIPLSADEIGGAARAGLATLAGALERPVPAKDVQLFTRELAALLKAGVTIEEALGLLAGVIRSGHLAAVLSRVRVAIKEGQALSTALSREPDTFNQPYTSMVRAGETSGRLDLLLERLADHLERSLEVSENIKSALVYPIILMALVTATLMLVMMVVLPQFEPIFRDLGDDLPLATRAVMAIAAFFDQYGLVLAVALAGAFLWFVYALRNRAFKKRVHGLILGLPLVGGLVIKGETAKFARTAASLFESGIPLPDCVGLAARGYANIALAEPMQEVVAELREGGGLAAPLSNAGALPDLAIELIRIGDNSGKLTDMLFEIAAIYDREVKNSLDRALAALVPALTILMGVIVAGLIASVLLGVMSINQLTLR